MWDGHLWIWRIIEMLCHARFRPAGCIRGRGTSLKAGPDPFVVGGKALALVGLVSIDLGFLSCGCRNPSHGTDLPPYESHGETSAHSIITFSLYKLLWREHSSFRRGFADSG